MKAIIKFEISRKIKNPKTWAALAIGIFLSFCYLGFCIYQQPVQLRTYILKSYQKAFEASETSRLLERDGFIGLEKDSEEYNKVKEDISYYNTVYRAYLSRASYINNINSNSTLFLENELELLELINQQESVDYLKTKYLLDHNINYELESYNTKSTIFTKNYLEVGFPWITLIIALLLSVESIGDDYENETFKLLLTQPISKKYVIQSKILTNIICCFFISIISSIIIIYFTYHNYGIGPIDYPLVYNVSSNNFLSIINLLPGLIIVAIFQIIFFIIYTNFILLKLQKGIHSFIFSFCCFILLYFICRYIPFIQYIIPNLYTTVSDLLGLHTLMIMEYIVLYLGYGYLLYKLQMKYFIAKDIF